MKRLLFLTLLTVMTASLWGQTWKHEDTTGRHPLTYHMILEKFRPGVVTYSDGSTSTAMLNYCVITQDLVFAQNGTIYLVDHPEKIAMVTIDSLTLVPKTPGKGELIEAIFPAKDNGLYVEHIGTATPEERTDAYGSVIPNNNSNLRSTTSYGNFALMPTMPHDIDVKLMYDYYISRNGEHIPFRTQRDIQNAFPDKASGLKAFLKKNKNRLKTREDYIEVYKYCIGE